MSSRITLGPPLIGAPISSDAPLSAAFERHGEGARAVTVLAIVSEIETAELFQRVLSRDRLIVAGDLGEAIMLAEAEAPEVVFLDVGIAEGAGLALVHHIKVVAPGATVFALASQQGIESGAHAVALGAAGLFILPLGGDEMLNAVHAVRARLVERAARGRILAELRAQSRASEWIRRMVELVDAPDWESIAGEVAEVFEDITGRPGVAVYVARDERHGELSRRAATSAFEGAPLFGTENELLMYARKERYIVVRLSVRKHAVGLVLLPSAEGRDGVPSERGGSPDGIIRLIAMQAATAFALRIERERAAGGAMMKDPSSSAYSFAYYVDVAGREIDRARRHGRRFSIATIVLGAPGPGEISMSGEPALRAAEVGDRLLAAVSDIDVVARIDEDEFHLLLPETDGLGAQAVRRRLLARLGGGDRRPVPRGVLVGMATFPHDGRDLAQLLRVARRRADASAGSIVHELSTGDIGLAEICAMKIGETRPGEARYGAPRSKDLLEPRGFSLALADAAVLATTAVNEALRGGSALVVVTHAANASLGAAVRSVVGAGRDGVMVHAIDTSAVPAARGIEALAVLAEHGSYALIGKSDGAMIRGCHAADPLFVDLVAERIGRAGGVRVLG